MNDSDSVTQTETMATSGPPALAGYPACFMVEFQARTKRERWTIMRVCLYSAWLVLTRGSAMLHLREGEWSKMEHAG